MLWLSASQVESIPANAVFVAMYLVATLASPSKGLTICFLAVMASIAFSLSPLYNYLTGNYPNSVIFFIYFAIYAIASIYFAITILLNIKENLGNYKPAVTCFIMALFEIISYETFYSEFSIKGFENVLYEYYEIIVTLLHVVVIGSVVRGDDLRSFSRRFRDIVSSVFLDRCWVLLSGGKTRYNKAKQVNREN